MTRIVAALEIVRCSACGAPECGCPDEQTGLVVEAHARASRRYREDAFCLDDVHLVAGQWRANEGAPGLTDEENEALEVRLQAAAERDEEAERTDRAYDEWRDRQWEEER